MATTKAPAEGQQNSKAAAPRAPHPCACLTGTGKQCSDTTLKAFHQGHDARLSSRVAQDIADGKITEEAGIKLIRDAGGSDLLISKTRHSAHLRQEKKAGAAAGPKTAASKGGPKASAAQQAAMTKAAPSVLGTKLKVTHGGKQVDAVVVRNASEELVARHRVQGRNVDHPIKVSEGADGKPVIEVTE